MVNKPKQIGTKAETAVKKYAQSHGFPDAKRQPLSGSNDIGDIELCPKVIVEVKADKSLDYPRFMRETEAERVNAGAAVGVAVIKPPSVAEGRMGLWWMMMASGTYDALEFLAGTRNFMASFLDASETLSPIGQRRKFKPGETLSQQAGYLAQMPGTKLKPGARRVSRTGWDLRFVYLPDGLELLRWAGFGEPMPGKFIEPVPPRGYNANKIFIDEPVNWSK